MRIISGDYKGRKLSAPYGKNVRPTSDKVKEAIFSMLMADIPNAVVIDLFAGTGNLGLEALSRGAKKCYFSDSDRNSIKFIKENVKYCKAEDISKVMLGNWEVNLNHITEKADIIFIDPPYDSDLYEKVLNKIESLDILADTGIIVAEHRDKEVMPEEIMNLIKYKEKRYGKIKITLYIKKAIEE